MKKVYSILLAAVLIFSNILVSFAEAGNDNREIEADSDAEITEEILDEVVDSEDLNFDLEIGGDEFIASGNCMEIDIPVEAEEGISIVDEDEEIVLNLPSEVNDMNGDMIDGTVIYSSDDENIACGVQTVTGQVEDAYAVRTMVVIQDNSAPRSYDFSMDLPDGYSIIKGKEYGNPKEANPGWLYVVDNNSIIINEETGTEYPESIAAIEPAWAKDANGEDVNTYYTLCGNVITQVVDFNDNSAFPIVADPTVEKYYYTKLKTPTYSQHWGAWKNSSEIINSFDGCTISVTESKSFSGSVTGAIKGISTIGIGTTITNESKKTWSVGPGKRVQLRTRAKYKWEEGVRVKRSFKTGKEVDRNNYTVKHVMGPTYREFKVFSLPKAK